MRGLMRLLESRRIMFPSIVKRLPEFRQLTDEQSKAMWQWAFARFREEGGHWPLDITSVLVSFVVTIPLTILSRQFTAAAVGMVPAIGFGRKWRTWFFCYS
ncbi:MAG: hypothetical protein JXR94_17850 [Candidatus Hydrogenedentes bacterium]|nr:hypothetical protein [Candidatus Hydrogenedentota bacterium]